MQWIKSRVSACSWSTGITGVELSILCLSRTMAQFQQRGNKGPEKKNRFSNNVILSNCELLYHRIIEYPGLERIHKDH